MFERQLLIITIFKLQKICINKEVNFKFIVDIKADEDNFSIKTTIKSKNQLVARIQDTIEYLKQYKEFFKYAVYLESCL